MKKKKNGFTLVELIIVISLLVVIAGMFTMSLIKTLNQRKEEENKDIVAQIVSAANTYVSINPEEIENLYNGYGYVDIPIGELRDKGLLSEDLKNAESGKKIPDDDKVRVKLDLGDYLDFIYPVDKDTDAWKFIAEDLYIDYTRNQTDWCSVDSNVYTGLITNPNDESYKNFKSKMYLMNNKEGDPEQARMYAGNYFDKDKVNLRVTSCNVNPNKVGTYNVTYKYYDEDLGTEKTINRVVYVNSSDEDLMGFTVTINKGQPIVRGTPVDEVPILIKEIYRNGAQDIPTTVGMLAGKGYNIVDLVTETVGKNFVATVTRVIANSDGTYPDPQKPAYEVIPDTYTLTFNPGNGTVTPKSMIVTYKKAYGALPTPLRTGYDFTGWFTESGGGTQVTSETIMMKLFDHTLYARWTPKVFTVTFNANGGSVGTPTINVTYDSTYGTLPTPSRSGYTFAGWYTDPTGGNAISSNTVVQILANQTLYAHWTPIVYNITFDPNGCGDVNQSSKSVSNGSNIGVLPSTKANDYVFEGWYTEPTGGKKVTSSSRVESGGIDRADAMCSSASCREESSSSSGNNNGEVAIKKKSNNGLTLKDKVVPTNLSNMNRSYSIQKLAGRPSISNSEKGSTLYARCTYNPPSTYDPYTPPSYRPSGGGNTYNGGGTNKPSKPAESTCNALCEMQLNSEKWFTASPTERKKLEEKNAELKKQAEQELGGTTLTRNPAGEWIDSRTNEPAYVTQSQRNNNTGGSGGGSGSNSGSSGSHSGSSGSGSSGSSSGGSILSGIIRGIGHAITSIFR